MKRFCCLLLCIICLSACALRTAKSEYESGQYINSVRTITKHLDEKKELPDNEDFAQMLGIIQGSVAHYEMQLEQTPDLDYQGKISTFLALRELRLLLDNKFYDNRIRFFTGRYTIQGLNQSIAEQFYYMGNSISGTDKESYLSRANAYQRGLAFYEYKDIAALYRQNKEQYSRMSAEEFYQEGKRAEKLMDYKLASESYAQAADAYKDFGKYKDSDQLFLKFDKLYRQRESQALYKKATDMSRTASRKFEYREISDIYADAYDIYARYGELNNVRSLSKKYAEKGIVRVRVDSNSPWLTNYIQSVLNQSFIRFVQDSSAEVYIDGRVSYDYREFQPQMTRTRLHENIKVRDEQYKNDKGVVMTRPVYENFYFTRITVERRNSLMTHLDIRVSGAFSDQSRQTVEVISGDWETYYEGHVPRNYYRERGGDFRSRYYLESDGQQKSRYGLDRDFNIIADKVMAL